MVNFTMQRNTDDIAKTLQNYNKSITALFESLFYSPSLAINSFYGYKISAYHRRRYSDC